MDKVTVEITSEGWKIILQINGEEIIEEHKRTESGSAVGGSDIEDSDLVTDELYEALNSFFPFEVMQALNED